MGTLQSAAPDFGFGFNNPKFSDKIIRIVIVPGDPNIHDGPEPPDFTSTTGLWSSSKSLCKGDDEVSTSEVILQEKCIHVCSLVLAAHSPFFEKLFSNGMKESSQQHATIHILDTEEAAFMDLLKFMYGGKLLINKLYELREVIVAAEKFAVASCIKLCGQLLNDLAMTLEVALFYLDLDLKGLMADFVKPNLETAKKFIVDHFNDITEVKRQEELLKLPLVGVEAVISSDDVRVNSEDDIYDFMLYWVEWHYSDQMEEGRKILNKLVQRFLRIPFLSTKKWERIMTCNDIDPAIASELALDALHYLKAQPPRHEDTPSKVMKRAYTKLPFKWVVGENSSSRSHCLIYLDLKRNECEQILCGRKVESETFFLGQHQFSLCVCHIKNTKDVYCFGLYFASSKVSKTTITIDCDIASKKDPSEEFVRRCKQNFVMAEGTMFTHPWDVFGVPWTTVISKNSRYFMNNILHLRFELTIKK